MNTCAQTLTVAGPAAQSLPAGESPAGIIVEAGQHGGATGAPVTGAAADYCWRLTPAQRATLIAGGVEPWMIHWDRSPEYRSCPHMQALHALGLCEAFRRMNRVWHQLVFEIVHDRSDADDSVMGTLRALRREHCTGDLCCEDMAYELFDKNLDRLALWLADDHVKLVDRLKHELRLQDEPRTA